MEISRVIIFTNDVKRLANFYSKCFGASILSDASHEWAELSTGTCDLAFHKIDEASAVRDGWIKIVFAAKNVAEEKAKLEKLGVRMSDVVEFGSIHLCDGQDPDGNWFQISSREGIRT